MTQDSSQAKSPIDLVWTKDPEYSYFCRRVKNASGVDLEKYKPHQMRRRLESYRARKGIKNYLVFAKIIEKEPDKLRDLLDFLAINVSEFFRNPDQWKVLEEKVLPEIVSRKTNIDSKIRVWSAGCSSGQEAYSLAAVLEELKVHDKVIFATDIDQDSLEKAKKGAYSLSEGSKIPERFRAKYFVEKDGMIWASDKIRASIVFQRHNLLGDPFPGEIDLISCRNVLIYFSDDVKNHIFSGFKESLRPLGYLFVGASESILNPRKLGFTQEYPFFYRRMENDG